MAEPRHRLKGSTPNYDHTKLEKILGGHVRPLTREEEYRVARILTDSCSESHTDHSSQELFDNALYWVDRIVESAYNSGFEDGENAVTSKVIRNLGLGR